MENTELLNDTIIAEALSYCDEFEPVPEKEGDIAPCVVIDSMNELEKRLHTLSVVKNREIGFMFENIMGTTNINNPGKEWVKELASIITTDENFHYYEKFLRLQKEAEACEKLMWMLIEIRINHEISILSIRPGFKIVALDNTDGVLIPSVVGLINLS